MSEKICRHFRKESVTRPRGLGWKCYYTPGVRDLYPVDPKFGRRGTANFPGSRPLPEPTGHPPGSWEKLGVLAARSEAGESLFHPEDAKQPLEELE